MVAVEGIGVRPVSERVAKAMQRQMRRFGLDETVDRIAVVAGNRGSGRLQAGDGHAIHLALDPGDLIETVGVGRVFGGERARRRNPLALIAPPPLRRLGGKTERRGDQERKCNFQQIPAGR